MKLHLVLFMALWSLACQQKVQFGLTETSEEFAQNITYNNQVDFIWIIDSSQSMQKHQQTLQQQIPDLVKKLNSLKLDYHMAVITTSMATGGDGGKFIGQPLFLTHETANLENLLSQRMLVGENGSNNERGLLSLETVLSNNYLQNEGLGFLRDNALLVINVLSDEDDKSGKNASYYEVLLDQLKPSTDSGFKNWTLNFIGVLNKTSQCSSYNSYSEVGLIYMDLALISDGIQESICTTNLTSAVSNIRTRILQILTDFKLSRKPNLTTLKVKINGVEIPNSSINGWMYIESLNIIRFYGSHIPAADAVINIDFTPAEAS